MKTKHKYKHYKRKTIRKNFMGGIKDPLRDTYGEMIIKKGTVLYHSSRLPFVKNQKNSVLFTTFHPSDWNDTFITKIIIAKDISLFFMVDEFVSATVKPLIHKLYLSKQEDDVSMKQNFKNLKCFTNYLLKDNFNGWFSTIEGGTNVEIALINDVSIFDIVASEKTVVDWIDAYYNDKDELIHTDFGKKYPIGTMIFPITLIINKKYKEEIEEYIKDAKNNFVFSIVLSNANILYSNESKVSIEWKC